MAHGLVQRREKNPAMSLADELKDRVHLADVSDGDEVRQYMVKDLGYSKADRGENTRRIGYVAKKRDVPG